MKKQGLTLWSRVLLSCVAAILLVAAVAAVPYFQEQAKQSATKEAVHTLQLAIERYSVDCEFEIYPESIEQIVGSVYFPTMPVNPYTGEPMRSIPAGQPGRPGDFTYVGDVEEVLPGHPYVTGYVLVGYGNTLSPAITNRDRWYLEKYHPQSVKLDRRHVIIFLPNGTDLAPSRPPLAERLAEFLEGRK
jgi:hypothetical protein